MTENYYTRTLTAHASSNLHIVHIDDLEWIIQPELINQQSRKLNSSKG